MAFSQAVAAQIARAAAAFIAQTRQQLVEQGRSRDPIQPANLARKLARIPTYANAEGANPQAFQGAARRAVRAAEEADRMRRSPNARPAANRLPVDPALGPGDERYRYRVAIQYRGAGGAGVRDVAEVSSDTPLSQNEIAALVSTRLDFFRSPRRSSQQAIASLQDAEVASVTVISAGRRG